MTRRLLALIFGGAGVAGYTLAVIYGYDAGSTPPPNPEGVVPPMELVLCATALTLLAWRTSSDRWYAWIAIAGTLSTVIAFAVGLLLRP